MKKSIVASLHIGYWVCFFAMIMVMLGFYFREAENIDARIENALQMLFFFAIVPSFISFYAFYLLLFPKYIEHKNLLLSTVQGLLISLVAGGVGYFLLARNFGENCMGGEEEDPFIGIVLFMAFIGLISGIIALVIRGFITWFKEIKWKEHLIQKNHEMELALVKAQLDPHFLFNTINNIDVLILKNANEASDYLNKLSDIMRFMLFETKTEEILLTKEIEYIHKYIALQKIRTANTKYVDFSVKGCPIGKKCAPMVFIPFIENAFKHTTNKKLEEAISIQIDIQQDTIQLACENKLDTNRQVKHPNSNGLGNELIQKRLQLIYPEQHVLKVLKEDHRYKVDLTIDLLKTNRTSGTKQLIES